MHGALSDAHNFVIFSSGWSAMSTTSKIVLFVYILRLQEHNGKRIANLTVFLKYVLLSKRKGLQSLDYENQQEYTKVYFKNFFIVTTQ